MLGNDVIPQGLWGAGPWAEVVLEVDLLGWKQPPPQTPTEKLFETPLAQQRYAFALSLIEQHSVRSVLDIGCGEGRLLEHLLNQVLCTFCTSFSSWDCNLSCS